MGKPRGRPFTPGNRFGRGHPKGSRNRKSLLLQSMLEEHGEALVRKCMVDALKGDHHAMKLCMERLLAPRREPLVRIPMKGANSLADIDAAAGRVLKAIAEGAITPSDGATLSTVLENRRRVIESVGLEKRIAHLERGEGFVEREIENTP